MPSPFQTCLLVTALAGASNAQVYLSLEDNQFHLRGPVPEAHDYESELPIRSPEVLDHAFDARDYRYEEEERLKGEHKIFEEVHHPHEAYDYGSRMDAYDHHYRGDEPYRQHHDEPYHEPLGMYGRPYYGNG